MAQSDQIDLKTLTAGIVAAFVSNNLISSEALPKLIGDTYRALELVSSPPAAKLDAPKPDRTAVRKSIGADYLTSFIDGRRYKSLGRHLTREGLTPSQYRDRFGLPSDYPMVAANYSALRSQLAKALGLGRRSVGVGEPAAEQNGDDPAATASPRKAKVAGIVEAAT